MHLPGVLAHVIATVAHAPLYACVGSSGGDLICKTLSLPGEENNRVEYRDISVVFNYAIYRVDEVKRACLMHG